MLSEVMYWVKGCYIEWSDIVLSELMLCWVKWYCVEWSDVCSKVLCGVKLYFVEWSGIVLSEVILCCFNRRNSVLFNNIIIFYYRLKTQHQSAICQYQLHSWQHVSAVNSHHQAKIEQSLGTLNVCTLWDPISFTIIGIFKSYVSWYWKGEKLKSVR